jgi:hypothetical protein
MEVTISPAAILDKNSEFFIGESIGEDASLKIGESATAYFSPPDDVEITSVNLHDTAPGVILLIATTTSATSTAIIAQNFSGLTIEILTRQARSLVPEEYAHWLMLSPSTLSTVISVLSISKPLTVINYPLPLSPPPPSPPSPSPSPPSPPPSPAPPSPPPPSPSPTPTPSPPPPSSPTAVDLVYVIMGVLGALLVAGLVFFYLFYRRHLQLSRDRANMVVSRDRANFDLQISVHVNHRLQRAFSEAQGNGGIDLVQREQAQADDDASLSSSVPSRWRASLSNGRGPPSTLPPGPPSSSTGQSVVEQEMVLSAPTPPHAMPAAPSTRPQHQDTTGSFRAWCGASKEAPAKRPAPPGPASTPRAKKKASPYHVAKASPYHEFCREQRPFLPPNISNADREKLLGEFMGLCPCPSAPAPAHAPSASTPAPSRESTSSGLTAFSPLSCMLQAGAGKHFPRRRRPSTKAL